MQSLLPDFEPAVRQDWMQQCLDHLRCQNHGSDTMSQQQQRLLAWQMFLVADMNSTGAGCLPAGVKSWNRRQLVGKFILQVDEVVNIAAAVKQRYDPQLKGRCLKLQLTDGVQQLPAFEYREVPGLSPDLPAGAKVAVSGAEVRHGMAMLTPETLTVLGGRVESLEQARQRMLKYLAKPATGRSEQQASEGNLLAQAAAAAWSDQNADPNAGQAARAAAQTQPHLVHNMQPQSQQVSHQQADGSQARSSARLPNSSAAESQQLTMPYHAPHQTMQAGALARQLQGPAARHVQQPATEADVIELLDDDEQMFSDPDEMDIEAAMACEAEAAAAAGASADVARVSPLQATGPATHRLHLQQQPRPVQPAPPAAATDAQTGYLQQQQQPQGPVRLALPAAAMTAAADSMTLSAAPMRRHAVIESSSDEDDFVEPLSVLRQAPGAQQQPAAPLAHQTASGRSLAGPDPASAQQDTTGAAHAAQLPRQLSAAQSQLHSDQLQPPLDSPPWTYLRLVRRAALPSSAYPLQVRIYGSIVRTLGKLQFKDPQSGQVQMQFSTDTCIQASVGIKQQVLPEWRLEVQIEDGTEACQAWMGDQVMRRLLGGNSTHDLQQLTARQGRGAVGPLLQHCTSVMARFVGILELRHAQAGAAPTVVELHDSYSPQDAAALQQRAAKTFSRSA